VSSHSIASEWVNAEVDWAFSQKKLIISVMLEMVTFENFMYLVSKQQIDFTGWKPNADMSGPTAKLFRALAGQ
jgi:hypothetical protein